MRSISGPHRPGRGVDRIAWGGVGGKHGGMPEREPSPGLPELLRLAEGDTVAVARRGVKPGRARLSGGGQLDVVEPIPPLHKVSLVVHEDGAPILKYGQVIGFARGRIGVGVHVHGHNVDLGRFDRFAEVGVEERGWGTGTGDEVPRTFMGYARPGGRAGTRNYLAVISGVNCSPSCWTKCK